MPKRRKQLDLTGGAVAGYLRKSRVIFPADVVTQAQRTAYMEGIKRTRVNELLADAGRDGETITAWYDDIGISGRGEHIDERVAYARMIDDARGGKVRRIYARELSRIGRDFAEGEIFFALMDTLGVNVSCADLPSLSPDALSDEVISHQLIRRVLMSVNQHMADQASVRMRGKMATKFGEGSILGRVKSQWGLTYIKGGHRFEYDPVTAPLVIRLFELFVDLGGNAYRTADRLNAAVMAGHPDALPSPHGGVWHASIILRIIRNPIWRQEVTWTVRDHTGHDIETLTKRIPGRIPEVVPLELLSRATSLLEARTGHITRAPAKKRQYTYAGFVACHHCGGPVHGHKCGEHSPERIYEYVCSRGRQSRAVCTGSFGICQQRLHIVVGKGLRMAIEAAGIQRDATPQRARRQPKVVNVTGHLAALDRERERLIAAYRTGVIELEELERETVALEDRRRALTTPAAPAEVHTLSASLTPAEWASLDASIDRLWRADESPPPFEQHKATLLALLGVRITLECTKKPRNSQDRRARRLLVNGPIVARIDIKALGQSITVAEDDATYSRWSRGWMWRK